LSGAGSKKDFITGTHTGEASFDGKRQEVMPWRRQQEIYVGTGGPGQSYELEHNILGLAGDPAVYYGASFTPLILNVDYTFVTVAGGTQKIVFVDLVSGVGHEPAVGEQVYLRYTPQDTTHRRYPVTLTGVKAAGEFPDDDDTEINFNGAESIFFILDGTESDDVVTAKMLQRQATADAYPAATTNASVIKSLLAAGEVSAQIPWLAGGYGKFYFTLAAGLTAGHSVTLSVLVNKRF